MEQKFKNYTEYDADSFREQQNVTYKAYDLSKDFIHFECKSPGGSVMLSDPVLETRWKLTLLAPTLNQQDDTVEYYDVRFQFFGKYAVNGGAVPVQSICESVVHRMGGVVLVDTEVYKIVEPWTTLNYNKETRNACEGCGTSPAFHRIHGTKLPTGDSVAFQNE